MDLSLWIPIWASLLHFLPNGDDIFVMLHEEEEESRVAFYFVVRALRAPGS
jgi:hypothetical protein